MTAAAKPRSVCLRDHEARRLLEHGRVLLVREVKGVPEGYEPHIASDFTSAKFRNGYALWRPKCPFGPVGTRLRCKECYLIAGHDNIGRFLPAYRADGILDAVEAADNVSGLHCRYKARKWRSSTHLPGFLVRLHAENAGVAVKRCRDVTEDEAIAAGVERLGIEACSRKMPVAYKDYSPGHRDPYSGLGSPGESLASLLGRPAAWERNAWLWLCDARRVN